MSSPTVIQHKTSPNAILDCHIGWFNEKEEDLQRCLDSLDGLENINIDVIKGGFIGHIGAMRRYGFNLRTSKYATFIDPDDRVSDPIHVQTCIDELESDSKLAGVYTDYTAIDTRGFQTFTTSKGSWSAIRMLENPFEVLHLKLYRRAAIQKHLDKLLYTPTYEEILVNNLACEYGPWKKLDIVGYFKKDGGSSMRLASDDLLKKVIRMTTPIVMKHHKVTTKVMSEDEVYRKYVPCRNCLGV